jgi:cell division protein FtsB
MLSLRYACMISLLLFILVFFQYRLWWEAGGLKDFFVLRKNLAAEQAENIKLKQRNDELLFQVERLRHSQEAIEARARNELGMIKKGETFYQIVK